MQQTVRYSIATQSELNELEKSLKNGDKNMTYQKKDQLKKQISKFNYD